MSDTLQTRLRHDAYSLRAFLDQRMIGDDCEEAAGALDACERERDRLKEACFQVCVECGEDVNRAMKKQPPPAAVNT